MPMPTGWSLCRLVAMKSRRLLSHCYFIPDGSGPRHLILPPRFYRLSCVPRILMGIIILELSAAMHYHGRATSVRQLHLVYFISMYSPGTLPLQLLAYHQYLLFPLSTTRFIIFILDGHGWQSSYHQFDMLSAIICRAFFDGFSRYIDADATPARVMPHISASKVTHVIIPG